MCGLHDPLWRTQMCKESVEHDHHCVFTRSLFLCFCVLVCGLTDVVLFMAQSQCVLWRHRAPVLHRFWMDISELGETSKAKLVAVLFLYLFSEGCPREDNLCSSGHNDKVCTHFTVLWFRRLASYCSPHIPRMLLRGEQQVRDGCPVEGDTGGPQTATRS